jgi:asparagine N-glycosylation enzyme membrane subunit Stt3
VERIMHLIPGILIIDFILHKFMREKIEKIKLPRQVISLIIAVIGVVILSSLMFGVSFIPTQVNAIISDVVHPIDVGRFSVTVAENRQPYFVSDWKESFGPIFLSLPLFFWMFFVGSVFLFYKLIKKMNKGERIILTFSYFSLYLCSHYY